MWPAVSYRRVGCAFQFDDNRFRGGDRQHSAAHVLQPERPALRYAGLPRRPSTAAIRCHQPVRCAAARRRKKAGAAASPLDGRSLRCAAVAAAASVERQCASPMVGLQSGRYAV